MTNLNFTLDDIKNTLLSHYKKFHWTGKIFDEEICDYKDLEIADFNNQSMHSFLFIDKENCLCERDIQISNLNFKIYEDSELSPIEKDLSQEWSDIINKNNQTLKL